MICDKCGKMKTEASNEDEEWITVNGVHILVKNGDKDLAVKTATNPDEVKKWDSLNKMQRFVILKSKGVKNIDADMYAPDFKDLRFKDRKQAIDAMK
jgi:hypothetical protein